MLRPSNLSLTTNGCFSLLIFACFHNPTALPWHSDGDEPLSPCGICRQVIREFCALKMPVLLVPNGYTSERRDGGPALLETTVEGLLPHSFGPEHLELP